MDINLLDIQPHQVSRDLRGYSVLLYGEAKSGKTTMATKFPEHLLLATEKGYSAIPGAMVQPIEKWSDFRKVLKQLKDEKVKAKFSTIIVDTVDLAYDLCEKYICANNGVDAIGDIPYGKGFNLVANEFDESLRKILQMDYGLVLISHAMDKTFKDVNGKEYQRIVPTLGNKAHNIVYRMCDLVGYSRIVEDEEGNSVAKLFLRGTPRYEAGSRFKYTPDYIDFNYNSLVNAISSAIDKQMEEDGKEYFTNERNNLFSTNDTLELNFDDLMNEFEQLIGQLVGSLGEETFANEMQPKVTQIIERYLGKGKKVSQCSRDQIEALSLIVDELKDLLIGR